MTPQCILITGASGAIGAALAEAYAAPGRTLILQGRDSDRLREIANRCQVRGARAETICLDLCDRQALAVWLDTLLRRRAVDLAILNAGINVPVADGDPLEPWEAVETLLEVNLRATLAIVAKLVPAMRAHGGGQIALMSSLAAYYGLPVTPAYCASKAALKAYGEALRGRLGKDGIQVSVIMPGFVESAMCRAMPGPKPFLWPAERAASVIQQGLARNRARISFPFPLNFGCWWLTVLPAWLSQWIVSVLGYDG